MVTQAVWLIQTGENTARIELVQHTVIRTQPPLLSSHFHWGLHLGRAAKRGELGSDNSPSYPNRIRSVHKGL